MGGFHPTRTCMRTSDALLCIRNWGQWATEKACCAPGAAFTEGCSLTEPCFIASAFWPARQCGLTEDQSICQRGWGAFDTEQECCAEGGAFSDG